mgnify:CR=1 FL=1
MYTIYKILYELKTGLRNKINFRNHIIQFETLVHKKLIEILISELEDIIYQYQITNNLTLRKYKLNNIKPNRSKYSRPIYKHMLVTEFAENGLF